MAYFLILCSGIICDCKTVIKKTFSTFFVHSYLNSLGSCKRGMDYNNKKKKHKRDLHQNYNATIHRTAHTHIHREMLIGHQQTTPTDDSWKTFLIGH